MTQGISTALSLQPVARHSIVHPDKVSKELSKPREGGVAFSKGCLLLVLEYAGDLLVSASFQHVLDESCKRSLEMFSRNALLSRLIVAIPPGLLSTSEERAWTIYNDVMNLAGASTIRPAVLKILDENPTMTPLRLLPLIMEAAKPVEDADLVKLFPQIVRQLQGKHPEARDFLAKIKEQPAAAQVDAIRAFMKEHQTWLKEIKELNLDGLGLSTFPEEITWLTNLEELSLNCNKLTAVPFTLCKLTKLLRLDLSRNQLSEFPEALFGLPQLEHLWLQHNLLTEVPDKIGDLSRLTILSVISNRLTSLPDSIGDLVKLRQLDVRGNKLTSEVDWILQGQEKGGCKVSR